jgi:uncharacterized membrane protein
LGITIIDHFEMMEGQMAVRACRKIIFIGIALTACTTVTEKENKTQLLVKDGQWIGLNVSSGPGADLRGSRGIGKFKNGYRADTNTFGGSDHPVIMHTSTRLTWSGPRTTCTITVDKKFTCANGASGSWEYLN